MRSFKSGIVFIGVAIALCSRVSAQEEREKPDPPQLKEDLYEEFYDVTAQLGEDFPAPSLVRCATKLVYDPKNARWDRCAVGPDMPPRLTGILAQVAGVLESAPGGPKGQKCALGSSGRVFVRATLQNHHEVSKVLQGLEPAPKAEIIPMRLHWMDRVFPAPSSERAGLTPPGSFKRKESRLTERGVANQKMTVLFGQTAHFLMTSERPLFAKNVADATRALAQRPLLISLEFSVERAPKSYRVAWTYHALRGEVRDGALVEETVWQESLSGITDMTSGCLVIHGVPTPDGQKGSLVLEVGDASRALFN